MEKEETIGDMYAEFFDKVSLCENEQEIMDLSDILLDKMKKFFPEDVQEFITNEQIHGRKV